MVSEHPFGFRMADISVERFELFQALPEVSDKLAIGAKLDWSLLLVSKSLAARLMIEYHSPNQLWAAFQVSVHFEIQQEGWNALLSNEVQEAAFLRPFLQKLGSITIGTARGILFEKTAQIGITPYLLPIMDASKLLAEKLVFQTIDA